MSATSETRPAGPGAACAAAHPLDEAVLCRRMDGHSGTHQSDGQDAWHDLEETA